MKTGGIILAAGMSSRMGSFKPLEDILGKPMIKWTIDSMQKGGVEHIVVVTGHHHERIESYIQHSCDHTIQTVYNEKYFNKNMLDSVKTGLRELRECDLVYQLLADMPAVSTEIFLQLKQACLESGKEIVLPTVNGYRKHPPLFSKYMINNILSYQGEQGLRGIWKLYEHDLLEVPVQDVGCTLDADTPEQLEHIKNFLIQKGEYV